jgi:DNA polymerase (family 10)
MTNKDIARALRETADLIELTGGNPYRANAFNRAARSIRGLEMPADERLADGTLTEVSGIGDAMAEHVADLLHTGSFDQRDELQNAVPPGLLDLMRVNGLGTKKVRALWKELDITSLDELERAAREDAITSLSGFGAKTQANILENVERLRAYDKQRRYADAVAALEPVLEHVREAESTDRAAVTGPLRRRLETVDRADLLVSTRDVDALHACLDALLPGEVDRSADTLTTSLRDGLPLTVHLTDLDRFGTAWWHTTGSDAHRAAFEDRFGAPGPHAEEDDLFDAAGLAPIPPEVRENDGELEAAAADALPSLVEVEDLHGSLHNHSTYSDGAHSLRTMAETARDMGLSYFGICDHSQSLQVAGGLSPEEVKQQWDEIDALNAEFAADDGAPFRIFRGIESDILADGALDYDEGLLASFDFVVASVHTKFGMTEAEATERIIRAVRNPHTRILGHPTGRLLLQREGYPLDHERVIQACAEEGVAIELNANPYRLDLDWRWIRRAVNQDVLIAINPDAHAAAELAYVRWGVAVARKGWLPPAMCLNAKPLDDFTAWIASRDAA